MKYRWMTLLLPFLATAFAGEHSKMEIKVISSDTDGVVRIDSDDLDFDLLEMQVGENRSIVDSNGKNVLITRTDDGFDLNVDGDVVQIPDPGKLHGVGDFDTDIDVDVIHKKVHIGDADESGAVIVTRGVIEPVIQEQIRSLLQSAGVDGDVRFVEGGGDGPHIIKDVRVIREKSL
ncbi:MAG: hypothetical protein QNJ19_14865 [Woeseiaceae bacterium]|nr:hypothetical protein [Woeseiaceae bacterium]